jgi:hypothetical protein
MKYGKLRCRIPDSAVKLFKDLRHWFRNRPSCIGPMIGEKVGLSSYPEITGSMEVKCRDFGDNILYRPVVRSPVKGLGAERAVNLPAAAPVGFKLAHAVRIVRMLPDQKSPCLPPAPDLGCCPETVVNGLWSF